MPLLLVPSLALTSSKLTTYFGAIIFIVGIFGGLLNILVFLSLRTFRENSCAFYLTISSVVNIGQLLTGLLSHLMISTFNVDWTTMTPVYCKLRAYFIQLFTLASLTSVCLAIMGQFFATSTHLHWRQWCQIKIAYRSSGINVFLWSIYFIPYLIFFDLIKVSTDDIWACTITNDIFLQYTNKFYISVLFGPLPLFITIIFALLAYRNIKQIPYRTVPLVRRELDKQMTTIVRVQVIFNVITITPCNILLTIVNHSTITTEIQFLLALSICIFYLYSAVSIVFIL